MRRRVLVLAMCALLTTAGCSNSVVEDSEGILPTLAHTAEDLCDMVPEAMVEENTGVTIETVEPEDGPPGYATCDYLEDIDVGIVVETSLGLKDPVRDPVADYFDGDYEKVSGLGDWAGVGERPSGAFYALLVVREQGDQHLHVEVLVSPKFEPSIENTRPIAERILDRLDH